MPELEVLEMMETRVIPKWGVRGAVVHKGQREHLGFIPCLNDFLHGTSEMIWGIAAFALRAY